MIPEIAGSEILAFGSRRQVRRRHEPGLCDFVFSEGGFPAPGSLVARAFVKQFLIRRPRMVTIEDISMRQAAVGAETLGNSACVRDLRSAREQLAALSAGMLGANRKHGRRCRSRAACICQIGRVDVRFGLAPARFVAGVERAANESAGPLVVRVRDRGPGPVW